MNYPLLNQLIKSSQKFHAPFYAPGHKRGKGASHKLKEMFGSSIFKLDLPELPELDNLFAPEGAIKESCAIASKVFGAKKTWFLINGSTCGIIASILATCGEGDKILLPRNIHQSVIYGLILSGAIPVFLNPKYDPNFDIYYGLSPEQIETALETHPDIKAVMIVSPTYHGVCSNIAGVAQITHRHHIPLLVDEAHGAHFSFHPQLPLGAIASGADLVIQSTHKTLGALTQASMLHLQGDLVNEDAINSTLQLIQSSSPSYLLLASLESATIQMEQEGEKLLEKTINLAHIAREKISNLDSFLVLNSSKITPYFYDLDITRLTINVSPLSMSGYFADEILHERLSVTCELPSLKTLTFIISIGNETGDIDLLIHGLTELSKYKNQDTLKQVNYSSLNFNSEFTISPRQAHWAEKKIINLQDSLNHICGETISAYPPGIPILMVGQKITQQTLDYLKIVVQSGAIITGAMDNRLETIKVVS